MKKYIILILALFLLPPLMFAQDSEQEEEQVKEKLERPAFESSFLIDNPTNVIPIKNTLEISIAHRFGLINDDNNDLAGFWAPSNIRIAAAYTIHERLTVGFGTTKFNRLQDFNWKVAVLRQTQSNKMPVSVTYYGNFTIDARSKENFELVQDRYSYFNQVIIARRFNYNFSLQLAPSVSHYNLVVEPMKNDVFALALGGRYKVSPQTAIMFDYSQPITKFDKNSPEPGISAGVEFVTSGHAFQLFITNYNGIVPQKNYVYNQYDFFNGDFLIGFNITRLYNF